MSEWKINPELDLVLDRVVDVPRERVWRAWTTPEELKVWFCPKPWRVSECEIDLRPGGRFNTVMAGPNGERVDGKGCYLEVTPGRKLSWTDAMTEGFRPAASAFMTGVLLLEDAGAGKTKYTAMALHAEAAAKKKHEEMGFHDGWGTALDQLVEMIKRG